MTPKSSGETDLQGQKSEVVATGDTDLQGKKSKVVATGESDLEAREACFFSVERPSEVGALAVVEGRKWRSSSRLQINMETDG